MLGVTRRTFASLYNSYFLCRTLSSCATVPASEYASRRRKLAADVARDVCLKSSTSSKHLIVLPSAELQYMAYHILYPFLQDSNFLYFTGLKDMIGALIIAITVQPDGNADSYYTSKEYLFTEVRTPHEELWDGPIMSQSSVSELTGIQFTSSLKELSTFLKHSKNANLWYAPLSERVNDKRPLNKLVLSEVFKIRDTVQNIYNPQPIIDQLRLVKSENEIQFLKLAAATTADCLKHAMKASHPGVSENFIRCTLEYESRIRGFALGYPPVVAGADRANVIHYLRKSETVEDGDLVLVDVGCRAEGYTADIGRTSILSPAYSFLDDLSLHKVTLESA
ncbi:Aminopeptidase P ue (M24 family) [Fasciolopsis buskii]|uniref:Aminopeptidase P ue (M24 family) n=1 Tax=Fasciolopsis buskii TaxID=27845 RepID=A0A8E0VP02_9TREM|nr:Aminopeptidase P ue (M24 family) [Fasciolopsis buski]